MIFLQAKSLHINTSSILKSDHANQVYSSIISCLVLMFNRLGKNGYFDVPSNKERSVNSFKQIIANDN